VEDASVSARGFCPTCQRFAYVNDGDAICPVCSVPLLGTASDEIATAEVDDHAQTLVQISTVADTGGAEPV
jgi:uncharacterized Zn finger protein (UPF0148 family)